MFEFRTESDKPTKNEKDKPRTSKVRHPKGPQKVEKVKDEEEKNDKEETYCFCSQVKPLFITLNLITVKNIVRIRYNFNVQVSYGLMIGCDNAKCEIGWFHFR